MLLNTIATLVNSLEAKDYITLLGLIITASISLSTLLVSKKNNHKTMYVNSITKERVESMGELKEQVSRYLSVVSNYSSMSGSPDVEKKAFFQELDYRVNKIMLQLNQNNEFEEKILGDVIKINSLIKFKESILDCGSVDQQSQALLEIIKKYNIELSTFCNEYEGINGKVLLEFKENFSNILSLLISNVVSDFRKHFKNEWEKIKSESK